jgi:hypothetical protein
MYHMRDKVLERVASVGLEVMRAGRESWTPSSYGLSKCVLIGGLEVAPTYLGKSQRKNKVHIIFYGSTIGAMAIYMR